MILYSARIGTLLVFLYDDFNSLIDGLDGIPPIIHMQESDANGGITGTVGNEDIVDVLIETVEMKLNTTLTEFQSSWLLTTWKGSQAHS